ncbi:MAG TPA: hypothetical protein VFJ30_04075, partial [Phycisphaerae bacterium]|nr:hypothetical protein [Phycisphaerae bacterium]
MPTASLIPKVPTAEELLRQSLPKELRTPRTGANQRRRPRVTIQELNTYGVEAVRRKWPDLAQQKQGLKHAIDSRSALEKVFDF